MDCYDFSARRWSQHGTTLQRGIDANWLSAIDPVTGKVYVAMPGAQLQEWDPATEVWTLRTVSKRPHINGTMFVDPKRNRLVIFDKVSGNAELGWYDLAQTGMLTFYSQSSSLAGQTKLLSGYRHGFV